MTPAKRQVEIFIGPVACSCAGGLSPARQETIAMAFALNDATPSVALDGNLIRVLDCPTVEELVLNAEGSVTD
jgi:hypothetical protein